jgi:F-type H+-transporting ATPase subunit delta
MLELVRGYAARVLDLAQHEGRLDSLVAALASLNRAIVSSDRLRLVLTDSSIAAPVRAAILEELLAQKVPADVVALATFPVLNERPAEVPKTYEQLFELAERRSSLSDERAAIESEPPLGRSGALERLRGYAECIFESLQEQSFVDAIEDELFRFSRIAEQYPELRAALADPDTPFEGRFAVLESLLGGKVRTETLSLIEYLLRCRRGRDLVGTLEFLVELAADERGRRVATVRSAVGLDADEERRLAQALGRLTRRNVELRVTVEPSVLGGIMVSVGDTVIDGTLRHRLEQLRDTMLAPAG